jgi:hypothetical protein
VSGAVLRCVVRCEGHGEQIVEHDRTEWNTVSGAQEHPNRRCVKYRSKLKHQK